MRYPIATFASIVIAAGCSTPMPAPDATPVSDVTIDRPNTMEASAPDAAQDSGPVVDVAIDSATSEDAADVTVEDVTAMDSSDSATPFDTGVDSGVDTGVDSSSCPPGWLPCGSPAVCIDPRTTNAHCGGCNNACPTGQSCVAGSCTCPTGQDLCGGACVDRQTNNSHCGACGNACSSLSFCVAGTCQSTCTAPRAVCTAGGTSVCVDRNTDLAHCGACNAACTRANATPSCVGGACGIASCNAGFADCDSNAGNGCEANTQSSTSHCGGCGRPCGAPANGTANCVAGTCGIASCNAGFADCDSNAANGCEVNTQSSASHCGACGVACSLPNATTSCAMGSCRLTSCNLGFADCDMVASNGCEIDTRNNLNNCGTCGTACATDPNGTATCSGGACNLVCAMGYYRDGAGCTQTPRLIAPLSGGDVTMRTPRLRWAPIAGFPEAEVELCTTNSCATVLQRFVVAGAATAVVSMPLPASTVVFWRVRGARGAARAMAWSSVWLFHTPAVNATTGVNTSSNPHTDFNGDGYDDFFRGSPGAGLSGGGNASLTLGTATGLAAGSSNFAMIHNPGDDFGFAVASAGDVDGNGTVDLVVGVPGADPGSRANAGFARVFRSGLADATINGAIAGDRLGSTMAGLGDVNGDGYADVALGAPSASPGGRAGAGLVAIHYGSLSGISASPALVLNGSAAGDALGDGVAGLGDVNGDGYSDVAIGAPLADVGGMTDAGQVLLFYGSATGLSTTPSRVLSGSVANARFGASVRSAGDVNNDGYSDVIIGAPLEPNAAILGAGAVHLFLGTSAGVGATATSIHRGTTADENFGRSASSAGDVNNDGFDDVIVGAPGADLPSTPNVGAAFLFHGRATGVDFATVVHRVNGMRAGDGFARWVAPLGDVNRDGFADFAVGSATVSAPTLLNTGATSVVFGPTAMPAVPASYSPGGGAGHRLGISIAG